MKPKKLTLEQAREKWPHGIMYTDAAWNVVVSHRLDGYNIAISEMEAHRKLKKARNDTPKETALLDLVARVESLEKTAIRDGELVHNETLNTDFIISKFK